MERGPDIPRSKAGFFRFRYIRNSCGFAAMSYIGRKRNYLRR